MGALLCLLNSAPNPELMPRVEPEPAVPGLILPLAVPGRLMESLDPLKGVAGNNEMRGSPGP